DRAVHAVRRVLDAGPLRESAERDHRGGPRRRGEHVGPLLADPRPVGPGADGITRDPDVDLGLEPVPPRPRARRGPDPADDGRSARRVPRPLRDRHPPAVRRDDPDPPADPRGLRPVPAPGHHRAAPGIGQGMTGNGVDAPAAPGPAPAADVQLALGDGRRIEGFVDDGYGGMLDAFVANFVDRRDVGAACCVVVDGRPVVDLWGGLADARSGRPWGRDTAAVIFSCTKGVLAILAYRLVDAGRLDLDAPIARYWPEFADAGKATITVRDAQP